MITRETRYFHPSKQTKIIVMRLATLHINEACSSRSPRPPSAAWPPALLNSHARHGRWDRLGSEHRAAKANHSVFTKDKANHNQRPLGQRVGVALKEGQKGISGGPYYTLHARALCNPTTNRLSTLLSVQCRVRRFPVYTSSAAPLRRKESEKRPSPARGTQRQLLVVTTT